jgi:hypothetical protein
MSTATIPDLPPFAPEPTARDRHLADAAKYFSAPPSASAAHGPGATASPSTSTPLAAASAHAALGSLAALTSVRPAASPAPATRSSPAHPASAAHAAPASAHSSSAPSPSTTAPFRSAAAHSAPAPSTAADSTAHTTSDSAPPPALDDIARDLTPPDEKSKSFTGWKELKTRAQGYAEKAAALERELAALRSGEGTTPADAAARSRLAELETQNRELSTRLSSADLRSHPEFIARFVAPQQAAATKLAEIARTEEVRLDVDHLLSLSGRAFNTEVSETLSHLSPYARVKFQSQLDTLLAARLGAERALATADQSIKSLSQAGGARSRGIFDTIGQKYSGAYTPMPLDDTAPDEARAAAAAYNADLAAIAPAAERYAFGAIDETLAAELAHKAALFDFTLARGIPRIGQLYEAELQKLTAQNTALLAQVHSLTAASPTFTSGAGTPTPSGQPHESHLEAARRYFAQG